MRSSVTVLFCVASVLSLGISGEEAKPLFYTVAVFEHASFGTRNDSTKLIVDTNLDYYRRAAKIAKSKGADVIVYPEYGIILFGSRLELKPFLENVPDPKKIRTNPCEEPELYSMRPIMHSLSCIAKNNSMVVVANMGDIQNCEGQPKCRPDGVFQYNTNVVFDRYGTLLMKYHKEHLYFEDGMDSPTEQQTPVFKTDFGTFATFICFDIMFGRMSEVAQWPSIEAVMYSTWWEDEPPQLTSVQIQQAWSLGNGIPLLSANIQKPAESAVGSGVFHGQEGALAYTFNPDGISKLVVSIVPKRGVHGMSLNASITAISATKSWEWKDDGKDVPYTCSNKNFTDTNSAYRCHKEMMKNYTLVKLNEPSGHVGACNNGMCCSLNYSTNGLTENFYLGVYNGTYSDLNRYFWCEESCVLTRCDAQGTAPCASFPLRSATVFQRVHLRANFTTDFAFPSVTSSGMRLVPRDEWDHKIEPNSEKSIYFENPSGRNLLAVGFKGRCYDRDPPFKR